jgi:glycosyltransferase involved in cell wall biosynthesis
MNAVTMIQQGVRTPPPMKVGPSDRPLRIAVVYGRSPLPMRRADQLTVAHLLAFLKARNHEVDLYTIDAGGSPDAEDMAWLERTCRSVRFYPHDKASIVSGLVKVPFGLRPTQVALFSHPRQRADVMAAAGRGDYDIVYTYYFRSAEITRGIKGLELPNRPKTFLAMQLSQTLNTRRIAENAPNLAYRLFYSAESRLVARYESEIWRHFDRAVLIGGNDVAAINETCAKLARPPLDNVVLCAHGVDTDRFRPRDDMTPLAGKLVFSGVMRTPTNVQAVQWFVNNVWPIIHAGAPHASFDIVGREPSAEVRALGAVAGVTVVGSVPDTSVPIASASVCINSMQAGGGMQNKLIEYLSSAKAVVATSVANEGIGATPGEHLLIADEPQDFADAVLELLASDARRDALGRAARDYILDQWTWEAHFLKLEAAFHHAIDEG